MALSKLIAITGRQIDGRGCLGMLRDTLEKPPQIALIVLVARRAWLPSRDPACAIDFAQEVVLSQIGRKQQSARDVSVRLFRKEKRPESSHRDAYEPDLFVTMSERGVDDVFPEAAENRPLCVVAIRGSSENRIDVHPARAKGVVKSVVEEGALVVAEARQKHHDASAGMGRVCEPVDRAHGRRCRKDQTAAGA